LTDSRFPGTTELLSAASVELKCVRANLEEQVRINLTGRRCVKNSLKNPAVPSALNGQRRLHSIAHAA